MIEDIGWWIIRTVLEFFVPRRIAHISNLYGHERGRTFNYMGGYRVMYLGDNKFLIL